jgi:hypothetical protein
MNSFIARLSFVLLCLLTSGVKSHGQFPQSSTLFSITQSPSIDSEITFDSTVSVRSSSDYVRYGVGCALVFQDGFGHFLIPQVNRYGFAVGEVIGVESQEYGNPSGINWTILFQYYSWEVRFPGNQIFISPGIDLFPGRTNVLVGFNRQHPLFSGTQYGWVRLERETADTKNAFREDGSAKQITFMPTGFAVNPIPDQPIRAGEPPDLPQLLSEVLPPEEGLPTRVRVSWAAGWANMRLESAVELGNPVQWSPVLEVTGTEAVFELPDDGQLYLRLAYVP